MHKQGRSNGSEQIEEYSLVTRVQAGDFKAVEILYERYSRQAYGLAVKILNSSEAAEDAVQDAFMRFWSNPGSFDPQRGRFATWLLSIVHNLCIDQLRRLRKTMVSLDREDAQDSFNQLADGGMPVEEEVWMGMQRSAIREALSHLPDEQRKVIELAFFKGLTHNEIAEETSQPLGTVKSRIRQGLLKLKSYLSRLEV